MCPRRAWSHCDAGHSQSDAGGICYQSHLAVHRAMVKAGAHLTSLGDSLAGPEVTSPKTFNQFVRPNIRTLIETAHEEGIYG